MLCGDVMILQALLRAARLEESAMSWPKNVIYHGAPPLMVAGARISDAIRYPTKTKI